MKEAPAPSPRPAVKKRRLLRELTPTSMVDKSLKEIQQEWRNLRIPTSGRKPELLEKIRIARSEQTTISFTTSKRRRPPEEETDEGIGKPRNKIREGISLQRNSETRADGRGGPAMPTSNKD